LIPRLKASMSVLGQKRTCAVQKGMSAKSQCGTFRFGLFRARNLSLGGYLTWELSYVHMPLFHLERRFPLSLKPVDVDANQLELALLNLTLNARDAMPDGGDIILAAREESVAAAHTGLEAGNFIRVSVTDTGEGMDEETLRKATEPFFTTKGIGKGTGLGLSMVHGFAEQSGGRLILHSEKDRGTTAELWLPVAKASQQPVAPVKAVPAKSFRPITVLAVDDDALVLMNTVAMLEDLGHTVFEQIWAQETKSAYANSQSHICRTISLLQSCK
jgi:hypothetical protein